MEPMRLSDSELRFMQLVWDNEPVASGRLVELAREKLGWKKSTVYTVLKKMGEKGAVRNEDAVVTACVGREAVQAAESRRVVERTFGGSLPGFVAAFLGSGGLTEQEAEELERLIAQYREEQA